MIDRGASELEFRDTNRARELRGALHALVGQIGRDSISVMHVCGSHEQAIARFGLRGGFPQALNVIMGPGCPVCVTDAPEVDEGVALVRQGVDVATYGDMLRVPGTSVSLADSRATTDGSCQPGRVHVVYSMDQAVDLAHKARNELVFFATGFETTAVTTAATIVSGLPANMSVLSAHKYIPPAMDIVARTPGTHIEGFLAAGHAATITGWGLFRDFARRHQVPVVIAGFEPLDILAALVKLLQLIRDREPTVANLYPRCVTERGNRPAQRLLWRVFSPLEGRWRGIAHIPNGNLRLRDEWAHVDARRRFRISEARETDVEQPSDCICGQIMTGLAAPSDCPLYGSECAPATPVGACMVSAEGACRIWHEYGDQPSALGGAP